MPASPKTKLIGTALLGLVIVLGTFGARAADLPAWSYLIWIAVGFVLLWLVVWWFGDSVTDDPLGDEQASRAGEDLQSHADAPGTNYPTERARLPR
ncbi:hypothetical protein [Dongia sp.]|uniref:hypothetical protein n=1 Tax=Dongia sp. TaxID=1977262 RepID=UPI003750E16F